MIGQVLRTMGFVAIALLAACQSEKEPASSAAAIAAPDAKSAGPIDPLSVIAPELRPFAAATSTRSLDSKALASVRARKAGAKMLPDRVEARSIPGPSDAPDVTVLIADPSPGANNKPAYLHMHGGGYVLHSASDIAYRLPGLADDCGCLVVSVDYRLAPETPFPGPMEDNFAALTWLHKNADSLGVDVKRIAVGGRSAGGGHAAQLAIAARDRGVPVVFQLLIYPMLDDRTGSTRPVPKHIGHYLWNEASNRFAWTAYLGQPAGADTAPYGAAPARVEDLSGLPPAWIGVGSADLFLAENLNYARRLIEAGAPVEVSVVPGGYHAFDILAPDTKIARQFTENWRQALRNALHPAESEISDPE